MINILKWDIEIGDDSSFWSSHHSRIRASGVKIASLSDSSRELKIYNTRLQSGECTVALEREIQNNIQVTYSAHFIPNIRKALDSVLRLTIDDNLVRYIVVDGRKIYHKNTNMYRYIHTNSYNVGIVLQNGTIWNLSGDLTPSKDEEDAGWKRTFYYRDERGKWIFHSRLLPVDGKYVVKNCTSWYQTRIVPAALLKFLRIREKDYLYRAEVDPIINPILRRVWNLSSYLVRPLFIPFSLSATLSIVDR